MIIVPVINTSPIQIEKLFVSELLTGVTDHICMREGVNQLSIDKKY